MYDGRLWRISYKEVEYCLVLRRGLHKGSWWILRQKTVTKVGETSRLVGEFWGRMGPADNGLGREEVEQ